MESLNWRTDIENDDEIPKLNWTALQEFAVSLKSRKAKGTTTQSGHIPVIYNLGRLHIARILEFDEGTKWVAHIQYRNSRPSARSHFSTKSTPFPFCGGEQTTPYQKSTATRLTQKPLAAHS
jgi:hypothetical protein